MAAPALTYSGLSEAATNTWYDLEFLLSDDLSSITVLEIKVSPGAPDEGQAKTPDKREVACRWIIPSAAFGSDAYFDMAQPGEPPIGPAVAPSRIIYVRNIEYGLRFDSISKGRGFVAFEFERPSVRWTIAYITNLWLMSNGKTDAIESSRSAYFHAFLSTPPLNDESAAQFGRLLPFEDVASGRISSTIGSMFAGQVVAQTKNGDFRVTIDSHLLWTVIGRNGLVIQSLGGQVTVSTFSFGWLKSEVASKSSDIDPVDKIAVSYFAGFAGPDAIQISSPAGILALGTSHRVSVMPADVCALRLDVIVGSAPSLSSLKQVVTALTIGDGTLAVHETAQLLTDGVAASELVLSQTTTTAKLDIQHRSVLWGMATGTGPTLFRDGTPGTRWHRPGDIISPVGRLRIGRPEGQAETKEKPTADIDIAASSDMEGATVTPLRIDIRKGQLGGCEPLKEKDQTSAQLGRLFQIANGDRAGAPDASVFVLHDKPQKKTADPGSLKRIHIDVSLFATSYALPDTSFSRLSFRGSSLRLQYEDGNPLLHLGNGEYPRPIASSFVWLGNLSGDTCRARFDLSDATLTAARDYDLMKLRFKFQDLLLEHRAKPEIRPARQDARISVGLDGTVHDTRPILVAEFDPQHVMEEAIFRPEAPSLPDVDLPKDHPDIPEDMKTPAAILAALKKEPDPKKRAKFRTAVRAKKESIEGGHKPFTTLATAYETASSSMPPDQRTYIGPFALDPDGMALARMLMGGNSIGPVAEEIRDMIRRIEMLAAPDSRLRGDGRLFSVIDPKVSDEINFSNAQRNEAIFESLEPLYGVFRSFWRDRIVEYLALRRANLSDKDIEKRLGFLPPADADPVTEQLLVEYQSVNNRILRYPAEGNVSALTDRLIGSFVKFALGFEPVPDLVSARLAGRSRLAFRIDCEPPVGVTAAEGGIRETSGDSPANTGPGNTLYFPIAFTFEALTDWSRFEAAVTRRASKLFDALPSGVLPRPGSRASNPSDHAMLRYQGFSEGALTGDTRMAEIRTSLKSARLVDPEAKQGQPFPGEPLDFETAIELPARLFLSTAQDAIWRTNRRVPSILSRSIGGKPIEIDSAESSGVALGEGENQAGSLSHSPLPWDLWSVRLETSITTPPTLRVVGSPDLRPDALVAGRPAGKLRLPGQGAPPRGPYAPWFIGPEQMESGTLSPEEVAEATLRVVNKNPTPEQINAAKAAACPAPPEKAGYRLIEWLCERAGFRKALPPENYAFFRTSLDAFDRHQLVLLSSTYGLPVIGKRKPANPDDPNNVDEAGALIANSGQIEPGESFSLLDAANGQAIHKPVPLNVQALSLSALGGSLLHDTAFNPSAGANDFLGNKIFEGFSIDTLQQDIVLGRDVRTEVVYKGYLLPLGHKASFVKLTERIFLRTPEQGIKAMLRQRMYLRMAERQKLYGAVGQPHGGRMWCGKIVRLLADKTPDILDPTFPIDGPVNADHLEGANGRIFLGNGPGLAFWPKTDITRNGFYRFEVTIDGTPTSLPMIFVDNIAATTAESLKAAVDHYNGLISAPHRKLAIGGLKIDYAPNSKSGEAQFETSEINIRAHGRVRSVTAESWEGQLEELANFETTPVLEGAGQPPFYPMLEKAVIRLGSVEKLSGGNPKPIEAQYDGHYILYGFPKDPVAKGLPELTPESANPKEVFLNLRDPISLDMGGNGDRAGGIARPNSHLIAISRKFGPLGGDISTRWDESRTIKPPGMDPVEAGDGKPNFDDAAAKKMKSGRLVSLASYFNEMVARPPVKRPTPPAGDDQSEPFEPGDTLSDAVKQVQSFFSLDAKLLGTIRLKDLMALLNISTDDIPILKEVYEFGTSALREGEGQVNGLANDIRTRVLAPLRDVVQQLRHEWRALDHDLKERQAAILQKAVGSPKPLSLADLYPEVDRGLKKVESALEDALATEDTPALIPKLAEIYTAARELIHNLAIVASNPIERLEQSLTGTINDLIEVLSQLKPIIKALELLPTALGVGTPSQIATKVTNWLFDSVGDPAQASAQIEAMLPLGAPPPDLQRLLLSLDADAANTLQSVWKIVAGDDGIAAKIISVVGASIKTATREAVTASLTALFNKKTPEEAGQAGAAAFLQTINTALEPPVKDAKKALEDFAATTTEPIKDRHAALALSQALNTYFDRIVTKYPEQVVAVTRGLEWASLAVQQAQNIANAVASADPEQILMASGAFAKSVLGVDTDVIETAFENDIAAKIVTNLAPAAAFLRDDLLEVNDPAALTAEAAACAEFHKHPTTPLAVPNPSSSKVLQPIAEAIKSLAEIKVQIQKLDGVAGPLNDAALPTDLRDEARKLHAAASTLIYSGDRNLILSFSTLYCNLVNLQIIVRDWQPPAKLDKAGIESIGALASNLRMLGRNVAQDLGEIVDLLAKFFSEHGAVVGAGAALAIVATRLEPMLSTLAPANKKILEDLKAKAAASEQKIIDCVWTVAGLGLKLIKTTTGGAKDQIDLVIGAVNNLEKLAQQLSLTLTPEVTELEGALTAINSHITAVGGIVLPSKPSSIKELLQTSQIDGKPFRDFFSTAGGSKTFDDLTKALRGLEDRVQEEALALLRRLEGAPALVRDAVISYAVEKSKFAGTTARGYAVVKQVRDEALRSVGSISLFAPFARKALLVAPTPGLADDNPVCQIDDPAKDLETLFNCDRLAQELKVLEDWTNAGALTAEARVGLARKIVVLFTGWSSGVAAPQLIVTQARDMAKDALRGDVLRAIDLGAFRDQIEDAIAALIPTKAKFSYDFKSTIDKVPNSKAIFQPKQGAEFGIAVRASVDLLRHKTDFLATAHMGPFDIYLIGDIADALRLKFDGAAFSMGQDTSPRFDVKYLDFVIGKDLEFAQKLQSYLSPKEGNGVFIQPMTRGAGIEVGYGINLGTIGVGATSFFNVSLNVSAELPFDNQESLFKVSLGRRLSPFTMGVFPFVGSGYFAIYAAADGVRGFEASFEYGGGAAIGYGPLEANVRVSAGVFIRIIKVKVDGKTRRNTELYGTFFAGGSASIWIFHFSTSLYVRLGKSSDGAMYGEAIYSFSFSVGFADYKYSITATREEKKLGSDQASLRQQDGGTLFASLSADGAWIDPIITGTTSNGGLDVRAKGQSDWNTYSQYFENELLEGLL
nr:hypothetical protein A4A59_20840 [Rhizobium leguminosarum]